MLEALSAEVTDLIDVALVWLALWAGLAWLRTTPARLALTGLAVPTVVYLVARRVGLELTTWLLQGFFAVLVLIAVVVFQQELRRLFEQIASLGRLGRRTHGMDAVDNVVRCLATLCQQRRGALIVIPGQEPLDRHLDGGIALDARVSEPLLLSLFDPHSPGHDGAVLLADERVVSFAVHLPLSSDHAQLGHRGTRHAAALGLSERTDALCIVVSEERGVVSIAEGGRLETLASPQDAAPRVRRFLRALAPERGGRGRSFAHIPRYWREGLLAAPLAAGLWFLAIPGSGEVTAVHGVPIQIMGLPKGFVLEGVDPPEAVVRLSGVRRDLLLLDPDELKIRVDVILVELGRRSFPLLPENVVRPDGIGVESVEPDVVKVSLRELPIPDVAAQGGATGKPETGRPQPGKPQNDAGGQRGATGSRP